MINFKKKCWEVSKEDEYPFLSSTILGHFTKKEDADLVLEKAGLKGLVREKTMDVTIFESYKEYLSFKAASIRETALKKLTEEEKEALGLKLQYLHT